MAMDEEDRAALGLRIKDRREKRYGTKRAAYEAARVNAATWTNAESGERVRPDILRRIIATLWPETEGDWTKVPPDVGALREGGSYVSAPGDMAEAGVSDSELLEVLDRVERDVAEIKRRLRRP